MTMKAEVLWKGEPEKQCQPQSPRASWYPITEPVRLISPPQSTRQRREKAKALKKENDQMIELN